MTLLLEKKLTYKIPALLALLFVLIGCEAAKDVNPWAKYPIPSCPKIQLLGDTNLITTFRSGAGRDITDILYEAEITGFTGSCEYIGKKGVYSSVKLLIKVKFDITVGPASQTRYQNFSYFVAIPEFHPKPSGRSDFEVKVRFPENRNTISVVDEEVEIEIPLKKSRKGPTTRIFIGFQLTPEQIEFNRRRRLQTRIR